MKVSTRQQRPESQRRDGKEGT